MTVGYLGPEGTFTHAAARELCSDDELVPVESQAAATAALEEGRFDGVVLPIDNSVNGVVLPTWDAILESEDAVIVGDTTIAVTFDVYTADPDIEPRVAVSHPHALAQTAQWIKERGLSPKVSSSTAAACQGLQPGEVAIAAPICGEMYPVTRIARGVEDISGAATQFALIRRQGAGPALTPVSERSIAVLAVVPDVNRPGALLEVLRPIAAAGLNLVTVVTRPIAHSDNEFMFILFVQGLEEDGAHRGLVDEIRAVGSLLAPLGRLGGQVKHLEDVPRRIPRRFGHAHA